MFLYVCVCVCEIHYVPTALAKSFVGPFRCLIFSSTSSVVFPPFPPRSFLSISQLRLSAFYFSLISRIVIPPPQTGSPSRTRAAITTKQEAVSVRQLVLFPYKLRRREAFRLACSFSPGSLGKNSLTLLLSMKFKLFFFPFKFRSPFLPTFTQGFFFYYLFDSERDGVTARGSH